MRRRDWLLVAFVLTYPALISWWLALFDALLWLALILILRALG